MKVIFLERYCTTLTKKFLGIACIYLVLQVLTRTLDVSNESLNFENDAASNENHNRIWNHTLNRVKNTNSEGPMVSKTNQTNSHFAMQSSIQTSQRNSTKYLKKSSPHEENHQKETVQNANKTFSFSQLMDAFPTRSPEKLKILLKKVHAFLLPSLDQLETIRTLLLKENSSWVQPGGKVSVIRSKDKEFFTRIQDNSNNTSSHTAIPDIQTVLVKAPIVKVKEMFPEVFFSDFTSNNCKHLESKSNYGDGFAFKAYNSTCQSEIPNALKYKTFHNKSFRLGLPSHSQYILGDQVILTYINVLRNAIVESEGDATTGTKKIAIRRCQMSYSRKVTKPKEGHVYDEVFSISQIWGVGFYHATIEDLPRITPYLQFLRKYPHIKIQVQSKPGFLKVFLSYLGIDPSRLVAGCVGARILYLPAGTTCGLPPMFNTALMSLEYRAIIPSYPEQRKSIVIIKRTKSRHFRKHKSIVSMLRSVVKDYPGSGFKVEVYPDNPVPNITVTMEMFSRSFLVIAPHGAGESNLIFSEPGTVMVEGLCKSGKRINLCYRNLGAVLGHRYYGHIYTNHSCYDTTPQEIEIPVRLILDYYTKIG